jgi:hypothetical protein
MTKLCPKCGAVKFEDQFSLCSSTVSKKQCWCNECHLNYRKSKKRERKEYARAYYLKNREEIIKKVKIYAAKNAEKLVKKHRLYYEKTISTRLLGDARKRANKLKLSFNLTEDDFVIPTICPVLNIPIIIGTKGRQNNSPSIDRIVPELGYIKGNICIISWRANRIKSDGTLSELKNIVKYVEENERAKGINIESALASSDNQ